MINIFRSLRIKLLIWYVGSLLLLVGYFLLFIHYHTVPYGIQLLALLFIILAILQFWIINKMTKSITTLSSRMKIISSLNLEQRITGKFGEDEIGELVNSFNSLLDRLNEAFQRERQFIGDVAHELKTPLATLRSSFEVALSKNRNNDEYKKVIQEAISEADELSSTLKNVLDLAWSETPHQQQNKIKFSLTELVNELFEIAQKMAAKKRIKVNLTTTPNVIIIGYRDKLARALLNIIENAIKFTPSEGIIELLLEKTRKKVLINVTDNGYGIPEDELPRIFDRFYRGSKTDHVLGAGLGLAIAQAIVTLHDGEIRVKSKIGIGSTFIVILPIS